MRTIALFALVIASLAFQTAAASAAPPAVHGVIGTANLCEGAPTDNPYCNWTVAALATRFGTTGLIQQGPDRTWTVDELIYLPAPYDAWCVGARSTDPNAFKPTLAFMIRDSGSGVTSNDEVQTTYTYSFGGPSFCSYVAGFVPPTFSSIPAGNFIAR